MNTQMSKDENFIDEDDNVPEGWKVNCEESSGGHATYMVGGRPFNKQIPGHVTTTSKMMKMLLKAGKER